MENIGLTMSFKTKSPPLTVRAITSLVLGALLIVYAKPFDRLERRGHHEVKQHTQRRA